ncbi:MAG: hypothetical protein ABF289_18360 [Clostridiales bacterium]
MQIENEIILDFGSGNTCKNDKDIVREMIAQLKAIDSGKYKIIIKWQLFEKAGENIPLNQNVFVFAMRYAETKGYKTTASVFDEDSLNFLLGFKADLPFVKIANNKKYYPLIDLIPRGITVYASYTTGLHYYYDTKLFCCISKYPAKLGDYEKNFNKNQLRYISDHTSNFDLYRKYKPEKIEWHYKLENSTGLDSGNFARTPAQLKEIL